jgi:hypothetical protein
VRQKGTGVKIHLPRLRLRSYLVVVAVSAALVVTPQLPAHAVLTPKTWAFVNGFEANNSSIWVFAGNPACQFCGYFSDDALQAHSGTHWASIESTAPNSFFSVFTYLNLAPAASSILSCYAQAYVKVPAGQLNLEVIDAATWTYVALSTVNSSTSSDYHLVRTASWHPGVRDVVFRASSVRSVTSIVFANVDDVAVVCTYY